MYDFVKSRKNLQKILENTEDPTPGAPTAYAKLVQIDQAIQNALQLIPEHMSLRISNGDATIVIRASTALAVQQYVTLFGCHLEYKNQVDYFLHRYTVVPNWK